jgi:hypothetical protein
MTFRTFTKEQRKQINTIMNVDDNLADEEDVVRVALDFLAQMCDPSVLESAALFYVTNDDDGNIKLEMGV